MTGFTSWRKPGRQRGYDPSWTPQKKTLRLLAQVEDVLVEYQDHLPLTVRQIFYRLVAHYDYAKTERAYKNLADTLVRARRSRRVSFSAIRDDGIDVWQSAWHESPADWWDDAAGRMRDYRRNRQTGQRQFIELWCEAAGMAPQLSRVADPYSIPVFSGGGFASLTAVRDIALRALTRDVPTVLLHVGDLDPSGESIFDAMASDAAAFVEADRTIAIPRIEGVRVALTEEQVEQYSLPTRPPKKSDSRSAAWKGETCQLEALMPDELATIVRQAIEDRMVLDRWQQEVEVETLDRKALLLALPHGKEGPEPAGR